MGMRGNRVTQEGVPSNRRGGGGVDIGGQPGHL